MSNAIDDHPVTVLNLSARTYKALRTAGLDTVGSLVLCRREQLEGLMPINLVDEIEQALLENGLRLKPSVRQELENGIPEALRLYGDGEIQKAQEALYFFLDYIRTLVPLVHVAVRPMLATNLGRKESFERAMREVIDLVT